MEKTTAFVFVGAPGSGKSTHAAKLAQTENAVIVSGDDIRSELYGSWEIQGNWVDVHDEIERQVADAVERGKNVILDGTHYKHVYRNEAITLLRSYGFESVEAVVLDVSLATCLARNFTRARNVPDYTIKQIHSTLQCSLRTIATESFDRFHFVY
jgi:predicted kinase